MSGRSLSRNKVKIAREKTFLLPERANRDLPTVIDDDSSLYMEPSVIIEENDFDIAIPDNSFSSVLSDVESWDNQSTSSSVSWFDEYNNETTQKLSDHLDLIEQVLYGEADPGILRKELRDECNEWIRAFPHLRICGTKVSPKPNESTYGNQTYRVSSPKCNPNKMSTPRRVPRSSCGTSALNKRNRYDLDDALRISPLNRISTPLKTNNSSLLSLEISSPKWHHRQMSPSEEYSSLPCIPPLYHTPKRKMCTDKTSLLEIKSRNENNHNIINDARKEFVKPSRNFILPPIEHLKHLQISNGTRNNASNIQTMSNSFRSISATPRQGTGILNLKSGSVSGRLLYKSQRKLSENNVIVDKKKFHFK